MQIFTEPLVFSLCSSETNVYQGFNVVLAKISRLLNKAQLEKGSQVLTTGFFHSYLIPL